MSRKKHHYSVDIDFMGIASGAKDFATESSLHRVVSAAVRNWKEQAKRRVVTPVDDVITIRLFDRKPERGLVGKGTLFFDESRVRFTGGLSTEEAQQLAQGAFDVRALGRNIKREKTRWQ